MASTQVPLATRARRVAVAAVLAAAATVLAGCSSTTAPAAVRLTPVPTEAGLETGITYWSEGSTDLRLDACTPPAGATDVPAVIVIHGGGFTEGSRDDAGDRALCAQLAQSGIAAFSIDYRLAPDAVYPAQVADVRHALAWLREPAQVTRFGIDPDRIALIGSSAGAILAQEVATEGSGALDGEGRVRAVVSLSGVSVMTARAERLGTPSAKGTALVLAYLGCKGLTPSACPQAEEASPITHVDRTDPPMLLVNGSDELVPVEQARAMHDALGAVDVPSTVQVVDGEGHGIALLDGSTRRAITEFLVAHL